MFAIIIINKMFLLSRSIRYLPPIIKTVTRRQPAFGFSKKLKQKLKEQATKQEAPVPEQRKIEMELSFCQRNNMPFLAQMAPVIVPLTNNFLLSSEPMTALFEYPLIFSDKFTALLVLTNISYPKDETLKYAMIGSVVLTSLIPTFSYYSFIAQAIQMTLLLLNDRKPIPLSKIDLVTPHLQRIMANKTKIKLTLFFFISAVVLFKVVHMVSILQMKTQIKAMNKINARSKANNLDPTQSNLLPSSVPNELSTLNFDIVK